MRDHLIAVDAGTGSVRAAVFDAAGVQLSRAVALTGIQQPQALHYEQSSDSIWQAVVSTVKQACSDAEVEAKQVAALGFDATCSLVFRSSQGLPVSVSKSGAREIDTIMWMDHRAIAEAEEISASGDDTISRFGGRISPEMQLPKLLWVKRHLPDRWAETGLIFDLCDFLTWKATGANARSHSSLSTKWGFQPEAPALAPATLFSNAGLSDLIDRAGLPDLSLPPSSAVGKLTPDVARSMGLDEECIVAAGLIDAYAGAVGVFCESGLNDLQGKAALVAGTSSCIVTLGEEPIEKNGCWGGFRDAAVPGLWLLESGQSASGSLLDHIAATHPAAASLGKTAHLTILDEIAERVADHGFGYGRPIAVLPDFHGARAPVADASLTGAVSGLSLDRGPENLFELYWRSCVGLACGIRHVLENMPCADDVETLLMTGGFANHPLIPQLYANTTGRTILFATKRDDVLLGVAVNAGVASGLYSDFEDASSKLSCELQAVSPDPATQAILETDYQAYHAMRRHREELARIFA